MRKIFKPLMIERLSPTDPRAAGADEPLYLLTEHFKEYAAFNNLNLDSMPEREPFRSNRGVITIRNEIEDKAFETYSPSTSITTPDSSNKKIWVTFARKGIHRFPAAENDEKLQDVSYLGYPHRHLFKFKVTIQVWHDDREIEFHQFLNWLESLYDEKTLELDYQSCEMIADALAAKIQDKFPGRKLTIDISEDGECGAICEYE